MKSLNIVILLSIILVAGVATVPSFAQTPAITSAIVEPITVTTDKESYAAGETVTVTGDIRQSLQGAVALKVTAPNGNRVTFDQLTVDETGSFSTTFVAGGPLWSSAGSYEIVVAYGAIASNIVTNTATIEFTGGAISPTPDAGTDDVDPLAGITASITGGTITSISVSSDISFTIIIDATDDGTLTLVVPRDIFESKTNVQIGDDVPVSVIVDGAETDVVETKEAGIRTIEIPFTAGTETIEVYGSWIIPEFGVIAIAILAVAIMSIIAVSSRSSVSILPRY